MTRSVISFDEAASRDATSSPPRPSETTRPGARLATLVVSHPVLDAYAGYVPPLIAVFEVRCEITATQGALLLSLGSLTSGLCQPVFAWLTDRTDSRALGTVGLAVAAAALSSIGLATNFTTLVLLFTIGMLGVGAYHPVAAASVGQLAGRRRSAGVTAFFVAGMLGATAGPIISTRLAAIGPHGFDLLRWTMVPGLVIALVLHAAIRGVPHRHHADRTVVIPAREARQRWTTTFLLFAGNAARYSVYMALVYLYVRFALDVVGASLGDVSAGELAAASAIYSGELTACMVVGMAIGGLAAGMLVPPGREKWALVLVPIVLAPALLAFPTAGRAVSYGLAVIAGVGFASVIPITISVAQRLLPHRTSLASSLMMGGAWAIGALGPPYAQWALARYGMGGAFALVAGLLVVSALFGLPVRGALMRQVATGERERR